MTFVLVLIAVVLFVISFPRLSLWLLLASLGSITALLVAAAVRHWWLNRRGGFSL